MKISFISPNRKKIIIRYFELINYENSVYEMDNFSKNRKKDTLDEIWLLQHPKVFTLGRSENNNSIEKIRGIPVINSNRGGKITYHGPGQQIMYVMLDLNRYQLNVSKLINLLEDTVISTLSFFSIVSHSCKKNPGIYVGIKKICSFGLRINYFRYSSHGLALNVSMDLSPFQYINPCGQTDLCMTQISDFVPDVKIKNVRKLLVENFSYFLSQSSNSQF